MKGKYSRKSSRGDKDSDNPPKPANGKDYNEAGSENLDKVDFVDIKQDEHSMPTKAKENSVVKNYIGGKLAQERYFDSDGRPYLDIDYTDHGNPKTHPTVPHEHTIEIRNGKIYRSKKDR